MSDPLWLEGKPQTWLSQLCRETPEAEVSFYVMWVRFPRATSGDIFAGGNLQLVAVKDGRGSHKLDSNCLTQQMQLRPTWAWFRNFAILAAILGPTSECFAGKSLGT